MTRGHGGPLGFTAYKPFISDLMPTWPGGLGVLFFCFSGKNLVRMKVLSRLIRISNLHRILFENDESIGVQIEFPTLITSAI